MRQRNNLPAILQNQTVAPALDFPGWNFFEARDQRERHSQTLYGARAPVATLSELFYADAELELGARLPLPAEHEERAAYIVSGAVDLAGERFEAAQMLVFRSGDEITMTAQEPSRVLLLGGATMDGPRYIWWNFVSSSQERIEAAKADWKAGLFAPVPGDTDFIPLPE